MLSLSLDPYERKLIVARDAEEYKELFLKYRKEPADIDNDNGECAEFVDKSGTCTFLIFARDEATLVHELSHVVLDLFSYCNIDPRDAGGEPFCYMLTHLYEKTKGKINYE